MHLQPNTRVKCPLSLLLLIAYHSLNCLFYLLSDHLHLMDFTNKHSEKKTTFYHQKARWFVMIAA